jgi:ABC-type multidrug transport system fused ATPase/permease subunit
VEQSLTSLERLEEYLGIPSEAPAIVEDHRPPTAWPAPLPNRPILSVRSLRVRYDSDLPDVLQGVSFELQAREKLGIVGRSGSGKSTLSKAILRFAEPSEGKIVIDGIDVTTIGVEDLRSRLVRI